MARRSETSKRQALAAEPQPAAAAPPSAQNPVIVIETPSSNPQTPPPSLAPVGPIEEVPDEEGAGRYPVLSPLRFGGRTYRPDDPEANEVVMPRDQADALIAIDVLGDELS